MTDKDFSPLSASCVRALNDKLYEKRKVAALEIERMVKEFMSLQNTGQIKKLLKVLGNDFALSQNPNSRKGGLIGLAAIAIALGKDAGLYVDDMVKPVLTCFYDADSRVRYYGCESLYNIVKVARSAVLPFFNEIFDGLGKLAADPDQNVRSGSELLDRLMKDIVTESCAFDLVTFIPLLRERVYTKSPFARQFIVSWIMALDAVPDIDMLVFLPEILDGLFNILGDPNPEIRKMCEASLNEFLKAIHKTPGRAEYSAMINILISQSEAPDDVIQYTAVYWVKEFVQLAGRALLPFTSGIVDAILPCLAYDDDAHKKTREAAKAANTSLMKLIKEQDDEEYPSTPPEESTGPNIVLDVAPVVQVLMEQMVHNNMQTRIAALRWIYHLHIKTPKKIFLQVEELFPLLLKTLSDPSDEVVLLDLEVLAEISSSAAGQSKESEVEETDGLPSPVKKAVESSHSMNSYFTNFMVSLLKLFSTDRQLLEDRGAFIIRQLCLLLNAEDIYRCFSEILRHEEDMKFASHMIQTLSNILLTSTELFELRTQLKDLKTKESCSLFCCLYQSWCHNPVSTVSLCFLTQNYEHACDLLTLFGDIEVTVEFLTEIDKLVQLIESPIFTYLRLQLLDVGHNLALIKSLYGLLMLLPQSDAFDTLRHRLECIPNMQLVPPEQRATMVKNSPAARPSLKNIDFKQLREHFISIQEKHRASRRVPRSVNDIQQKLERL